jgi:acyl-CoA synthetase (AMP-forming)/AMP-acid ligase II
MTAQAAGAAPVRGEQALPTTIPGVVEGAAARFASLDALVDTGIELSFAALAERVDEAARALVASGVDPGDRVAVWAPNSGEWVIAALATYRCGATLVTLNTRFRGTEAAHILRRAQARLLFTVTGFLDNDYLGYLDESGVLAELDQVVLLRGPEDGRAARWTEFVGRAARTTATAAAERAGAVAPDDVSDIIFTSGTTGIPKGAMLTHVASIRAYDAWSDVVGLAKGDRYLMINPFFHTFGLKAGILACLLRGVTMVPQAVFDVPAVMARVSEQRITMLPGPPTIYQALLDRDDRDGYELGSLRLAVTGAATVPVELIRRVRSELSFRSIVTGYGLTESTGIATMCRHDDPPEVIAQTAGRPIPGVEVKVVDDAGAPLASGLAGEVMIRGYNVMKGYLDDPAATQATIDEEGWLRSGDIGVFDDRGNLTITDRKKDMFIVGGFNAYPAEIEQIMATHPDISQVAVVGAPDARLGEVGVAFVVARPGRSVDPDALIAWCRDHMANFKVPRRIEVVGSLPLNASGKVLKYQLRERAGTER